MHRPNPEVDVYLSKAGKWREVLAALRKIALDCQLTEAVKWGSPCYTFEGSNIVMLGSFKESCVLSFFKGTLLKDAHGILAKPGENTQAARVVRFTSTEQIHGLESTLKAYIEEAIETEKAGLKVEFKTGPGPMPEELQRILKDDPDFNTAFHALTPGRQRAYNLFFSAPKQTGTRTARIEKFKERILDGKGMNDCTCGLSKKLPACDGSHKFKE